MNFVGRNEFWYQPLHVKIVYGAGSAVLHSRISSMRFFMHTIAYSPVMLPIHRGQMKDYASNYIRNSWVISYYSIGHGHTDNLLKKKKRNATKSSQIFYLFTHFTHNFFFFFYNSIITIHTIIMMAPFVYNSYMHLRMHQ